MTYYDLGSGQAMAYEEPTPESAANEQEYAPGGNCRRPFAVEMRFSVQTDEERAAVIGAISYGREHLSSRSAAQREILARINRLPMRFRATVSGVIIDRSTGKQIREIAPYYRVYGAAPVGK